MDHITFYLGLPTNWGRWIWLYLFCQHQGFKTLFLSTFALNVIKKKIETQWIRQRAKWQHEDHFKGEQDTVRAVAAVTSVLVTKDTFSSFGKLIEWIFFANGTKSERKNQREAPTYWIVSEGIRHLKKYIYQVLLYFIFLSGGSKSCVLEFQQMLLLFHHIFSPYWRK